MEPASGAAVVLCVVVTVLGGVAVRPTEPPKVVRPLAAGAGSEARSAGNLSAAVEPSSWWLEDGTNVTLDATWVGVPAGCSLVPIWFRWAVGPGGTEGALESTNSSRTVFTALAGGSGTTSVLVRAAASLACSGAVRAAFSRAAAVITVASPLNITEIAFGPNPLPPNGTTELTGELAGGDPPYEVRVTWGDGSTSLRPVIVPGPFAIAHAFPVAGTYEASVLVTDRAGDSATARPGEPLNVSSSFAVAIVPSDPVAEVGVPAAFGVRIVDAPSAFSSLFACDDANPSGAENSSNLTYGCAFDAPGVAAVYFEAVGADLPFAVATAALTEPVVAPPSVSFAGLPPSGEVGGTDYAPVQLTGGVPPLTVAWSLVGAGSQGTQTTSADGTVYLPLACPTAGTLLLSVVVTDSLGVVTAAAEEEVEVVPRLVVSASAVSTPDNASVAVNVSGSAVQGADPLAWAIVPSSGAENGTVLVGTLPQGGPFAWNASYRAEGALEVTAVVVDAAGAVGIVNLSVPLLPELAVTAGAGGPAAGEVRLSLAISGGVPPYAYRWTDSFGDLWNGSVEAPGVTTLVETAGGAGPAAFDVVVTDALGVSASSRVRAVIAAPGPSSNAAEDAALALGGTGIAALVVAAVLVRFRRPSAPPPPAPDPVEVLRDVIEPSDGVDRGMVELLAEERGVPLEAVRATLERLKADGTVRSGRGSDGEEVLAWSRPYER